MLPNSYPQKNFGLGKEKAGLRPLSEADRSYTLKPSCTTTGAPRMLVRCIQIKLTLSQRFGCLHNRRFQPWRPPYCGQNQRFRHATNRCHDQTSVARIWWEFVWNSFPKIERIQGSWFSNRVDTPIDGIFLDRGISSIKISFKYLV